MSLQTFLSPEGSKKKCPKHAGRGFFFFLFRESTLQGIIKSDITLLILACNMLQARNKQWYLCPWRCRDMALCQYMCMSNVVLLMHYHTIFIPGLHDRIQKIPNQATNCLTYHSAYCNTKYILLALFLALSKHFGYCQHFWLLLSSCPSVCP